MVIESLLRLAVANWLNWRELVPIFSNLQIPPTIWKQPPCFIKKVTRLFQATWNTKMFVGSKRLLGALLASLLPAKLLRFYKANDSQELPKYFTIATEVGGGMAATGLHTKTPEVKAHSGRSFLDSIIRDQKVPLGLAQHHCSSKRLFLPKAYQVILSWGKWLCPYTSILKDSNKVNLCSNDFKSAGVTPPLVKLRQEWTGKKNLEVSSRPLQMIFALLCMDCMDGNDQKRPGKYSSWSTSHERWFCHITVYSFDEFWSACRSCFISTFKLSPLGCVRMGLRKFSMQRTFCLPVQWPWETKARGCEEHQARWCLEVCWLKMGLRFEGNQSLKKGVYQKSYISF